MAIVGEIQWLTSYNEAIIHGLNSQTSWIHAEGEGEGPQPVDGFSQTTLKKEPHWLLIVDFPSMTNIDFQVPHTASLMIQAHICIDTHSGRIYIYIYVYMYIHVFRPMYICILFFSSVYHLFHPRSPLLTSAPGSGHCGPPEPGALPSRAGEGGRRPSGLRHREAPAHWGFAKWGLCWVGCFLCFFFLGGGGLFWCCFGLFWVLGCVWVAGERNWVPVGSRNLVWVV